MQEIQRVLIVGAGAVGAAIASVIHRAAPEAVSVLADGERLERYRRDGFTVNGQRYAFPALSPADAPADGTGWDLVLVAVKAHHLPEAIGQMRPFVGSGTTVVSLLNGISSEDILGAAFGAGPLAPAGATTPPLAMVLGIDAVRIGNDTRFGSTGKIHFGEALNPPDGWSERVRRLDRFFTRVGVAHVVPENMLRALWYKFMINIGINQPSAVVRAPYKVFKTVPEARELMLASMREVIALSQAIGVDLDESDLTRWETTLAGLRDDNLTSMCQDVLAGRKTEVEIFAGTVVELGRRYGVATPLNEVWFKLFRAIEATGRPT